MKDELVGLEWIKDERWIRMKLVGLRAKTYSYLTDDGSGCVIEKLNWRS